MKDRTVALLAAGVLVAWLGSLLYKDHARLDERARCEYLAPRAPGACLVSRFGWSVAEAERVDNAADARALRQELAATRVADSLEAAAQAVAQRQRDSLQAARRQRRDSLAALERVRVREQHVRNAAALLRLNRELGLQQIARTDPRVLACVRRGGLAPPTEVGTAGYPLTIGGETWTFGYERDAQAAARAAATCAEHLVGRQPAPTSR